MDAYKEFQGKTLDEAIEEACRYYGVEREKLEIEIVSDAKGGIFGLVGSKKASVRAARVQVPGLSSLLDEDAPAGDAPAEGKGRADKGREKKPRETGRKSDGPAKGRGREKAEPAKPEGQAVAAGQQGSAGRSQGKGRRGTEKTALPLDEFGDVNGNIMPAAVESNETQGGRQERERPRNAAARPAKGPSHERQGERESGKRQSSPQAGKPSGDTQEASKFRDDVAERIAARKAARREGSAGVPSSPASPVFDEGPREELPAYDLENCNQDVLFTLVRETVNQLVVPIVGEMTCSLAIVGSRIKVTIECGESSGLLVGREGQTLASVQYIASRIIAKKLGGTVRLQFDAGNYRERQDERLRELALSLAERVKKNRRSLSTRPLSAYQRRVIHLALEGDELVHTFSKGEGLQRRVIVQLRRGDASEAAEEAEDQDTMIVDSFEIEDSETDAERDL